VYESAEEELVQLLEHKRISAHRWAADEGEEVSPRQFSADAQLWCAEGQLNCSVGDKTYSLQAGDVLDIPANLRCNIRVGFGGCVCYESAREKAVPSS
jgi:quercetin dioxygenase-like cupin family protein